MILEILSYPDPRLRKTCQPVEEITPEIRQLADDMLETMYHAKGVGLAAPQIGKSLRMIVLDPAAGQENPDPRVIINPKLELLGEEIISEQEGCLSVPLGYRADVCRNSRVHVQGIDMGGNSIDEIWENFPAIIIQHENDHLDGKLFIDKLSHLRRTLYDTKVKKWMKHKSDA